MRRAALPELARHYAGEAPRGEITVVLGPAEAEAPDAADVDERLRAALVEHRTRDAAAMVAAATGLARKTVYARALKLARRDKDLL